jgi:exodeoxyribonuclease VII small subunit
MAKVNDYKGMMAELTEVLAAMQSSDIAVDDALEKYERGQKLIAELHAYLETAENTITKRKSE